MFDTFARAFSNDQASRPNPRWEEPCLMAAAGYAEFTARFAGCSFNQGLYRVHDDKSGPGAAVLLQDAFRDFRDRAWPFGYDWLGRQFAIDTDRRADGAPLILLFEPGTGEALEVPLTFEAFHDQLYELREPALAASFFDAWSQANPSSLPLQRAACVGYATPLFLGGTDSVDNLEVTDLDVYLSLSAQLRGATRGETPGTAIEGVTRAP